MSRGLGPPYWSWFMIFQDVERYCIVVDLKVQSLLPEVILVPSIYIQSMVSVLGTSMPYLWVLLTTRVLKEAMILSLFLRVYGNHHQKAGSPSIPLVLA